MPRRLTLPVFAIALAAWVAMGGRVRSARRSRSDPARRSLLQGASVDMSATTGSAETLGIA